MVLVGCVGALVAVSMQVRCVDAAREAARLAARGERTQSANGIAPASSRIDLRRDGEFVVAVVAVRSRLLPGVVISADAVAAVEPGSR